METKRSEETTSTGGATAAAARAQGTDQTEATKAENVHAGQVFRGWFNERVRRLVNPTIKLGTKTASVVQLLADGRLECSIHGETGEAGEPQQFVAFEEQYLNQLLPRIAALDL